VETSIGDLARLVLELVGAEDTPIRYEERRRGEVERTFSTAERAAALLGFEPAYPLRDGLSMTVDWFSERV
jgi:UDP-glucose 4-epimerase